MAPHGIQDHRHELQKALLSKQLLPEVDGVANLFVDFRVIQVDHLAGLVVAEVQHFG